MMKVWPIKDKVIKLMGFKQKKETMSRMDKDRKIASIANQLSQEIDRATEEYKRHITRFAHHLLKDQLK